MRASPPSTSGVLSIPGHASARSRTNARRSRFCKRESLLPHRPARAQPPQGWSGNTSQCGAPPVCGRREANRGQHGAWAGGRPARRELIAGRRLCARTARGEPGVRRATGLQTVRRERHPFAAHRSCRRNHSVRRPARRQTSQAAHRPGATPGRRSAPRCSRPADAPAACRSGRRRS